MVLVGTEMNLGAEWLNGRVLDLKIRGYLFEPHRKHSSSVVFFSKALYPDIGNFPTGLNR